MAQQRALSQQQAAFARYALSSTGITQRDLARMFDCSEMALSRVVAGATHHGVGAMPAAEAMEYARVLRGGAVERCAEFQGLWSDAPDGQRDLATVDLLVDDEWRQFCDCHDAGNHTVCRTFLALADGRRESILRGERIDVRLSNGAHVRYLASAS